MKGYFTINKIHVFSNLAIDEPYDQHNAGVKDDGGAVGLTECPATLQKWMFSGTDMALSLLSMEDESIAHCAGGQECRRYSRKMQCH